MKRWVVALAMVVPTVACSGTAVIDGGEELTSTSPAGCTEHADCADGVCVFGTGQCTPTCSRTEPCAPGMVCAECATSSCPACRDCVAACLPGSAGRCDDWDDCPTGWRCLYDAGRCAPPCTTAGECEDPSRICSDCATSSCPTCKDCVSACVEPF